MEPQDILRLEAVLGEKASRIIRKHEKRAKDKARQDKTAMRNFPTWEMRRENCYHERMRQRKHNRAVHLARAFLKGTPYKTVEQTTHEAPNVGDVHEVLFLSGVATTMGPVKGWINATTN